MNKIYSSLLAFLLLLAIGTAKAQHFTPDISAFDNYMTIIGYVVIDGEEIGSANYEIGCFINGQCRGSYQVAAIDYLGHAYTCFLSVWGSSSDNGKAITIKVYDQSAGTEYESDEKPVFQYNGELGTDVPYQLTVLTDPSQMLYYVTTGSTENGSVAADKTPVKSGTPVTLTITPNAGYELATIAAAKTNDLGTTVALTGTGSTRTFIMPAYGVTVTATFQKTADQQAVEAAKTLIEEANFAPIQTDATDETMVKTWLTSRINALPGMSGLGITVSANDITIHAFSAALAGSSGNPNGTNGTFSFSVDLGKGASSKTTASKNGSIKATKYVAPAAYSIETAAIINGLVTPDVTSSVAGETVTLIITPFDGFELNAIKAYKTGETATVVTLFGTGNARIFTMPAYPVTVSATFKKTEATLDAEAVTTAKELIENEQFSFNQVDGNTEVAIKQQLAYKINTLPGMSGTGITVSANDIAINAFSAAVAGSSGNPNGTNGTFSFTVDLEKGASVATTSPKTGTVLPTVYIPVTTVTLNQTTATIMEGESEMLIATVSPGNATNPDIVWTSSDASVATVNASGLVTGILRGTATITATTINGLMASCLVTVDGVTGIDNLVAAQLKIYPNPALTELRIESRGLRIKNLVISDLQGRKVVNCKWSDNQSVDVSQLAPGVYVVIVETENGEKVQHKIMKN